MAESEHKQPDEPISVYLVLMAMVEQMASIAWQKMGLQPDAFTGKISKDIDEAKTAVDVTVGLAAFLEPKLDEEDKHRIQNLIRDLRINFISQAKEAPSE